MDNILYQLKGSKFITLLPPCDVGNILNDPEIHSSSNGSNIFYPYNDPFSNDNKHTNDNSTKTENFKKILKALEENAMTAILEPGDILFLPRLWFHNIYSMSSNVPAISLNIFWKELEKNQYEKKDLYGNKDLSKARVAFSHFDSAISLLKEISCSSDDYLNFYLKKLNLKMKKLIQNFIYENGSQNGTMI